MKGTFYAVGVGPGDPELLTMKAIRTIRECPVLAVPISDPECGQPIWNRFAKEERWLGKCAAYQILTGADLDVTEKEMLYLPMPMIREKERLRENHDRCAKQVMEILDVGLDIACVTLGDPSIYATTSYIKVRLEQNGYRTALIPGVPSFCAAAAGLNVTLAENREEIHILPASYDIEKSLSLSGTRILMKTASRTAQVREALEKRGMDALMAENCGMEQEQFYHSVKEIPDKTSYYSLYIVKEPKEETKW